MVSSPQGRLGQCSPTITGSNPDVLSRGVEVGFRRRHGADPCVILPNRAGNVALPAMAHQEDVGDGRLVSRQTGQNGGRQEGPVRFLALFPSLSNTIR